MSILPDLPRVVVTEAVRAALREDLGRAGDITSNATIPLDAVATAHIGSRGSGVLSGLSLAEYAFAEVDPSLHFEAHRRDGDTLEEGDTVATVAGAARSVLAAERVALNYLCHLSGIATATAAFVAAVAHTKARITCTRKTTPGLRMLEKYAVRCGGGINHRFGLDDAVLIKDNHIAIAGGAARAVESARAVVGHLVKIEVEVDDLVQLADALAARPDVVLLDNMTPDQLHAAVRLVAGRAVTEASGGITLHTVGGIAETGVDVISSGWITHSAPTLDLGLDIRNAGSSHPVS